MGNTRHPHIIGKPVRKTPQMTQLFGNLLSNSLNPADVYPFYISRGNSFPGNVGLIHNTGEAGMIILLVANGYEHLFFHGLPFFICGTSP